MCIRVLVVSYRNSTSNHNEVGQELIDSELYLIEILHQTTTNGGANGVVKSCILSKFYIKPQHITPDYLSYKVVSYRNSTSNHNPIGDHVTAPSVVSYRNSTSNHNYGRRRKRQTRVVSYRNSTSNHNYNRAAVKNGRLYLIEILHQTTTHASALVKKQRCILSKFYIKPQHVARLVFFTVVVSYRNSTSNHNSCLCISEETALYLIEILHQTTTCRPPCILYRRCILSKFYIKPQHSQCHFVILGVVSYRNSTSNHNTSPALYSLPSVVSYRNSTSNHNTRNVIS